MDRYRSLYKLFEVVMESREVVYSEYFFPDNLQF